MANHGENQPQTTWFPRLLGGGYLVYSGASILADETASLPVTAGAAVFLLAGVGLLAVTLPAARHRKRQGGQPESAASDEK